MNTYSTNTDTILVESCAKFSSSVKPEPFGLRLRAENGHSIPSQTMSETDSDMGAKYILQVVTDNQDLKLSVTANTTQELQTLSAKMVKQNPLVKGLPYRVFSQTFNEYGNLIKSELLKEDFIGK